ncbi:MAG: protein kinase [Planctomycetes bacterium]|nr:protein kinase [Planctomycetota bacterium]
MAEPPLEPSPGPPVGPDLQKTVAEPPLGLASLRTAPLVPPTASAPFPPPAGHATHDPQPEEVRVAALSPENRHGKYVVVGPLGRGGMGVVFKAYDLDLRRFVALKWLTSDTGPVTLGSMAEAEERFLREARALARLSHPNIVQVHEVGVHGDRPFLALEYVDHGSLRDFLLAEGPHGAAPPPPSVERTVAAPHGASGGTDAPRASTPRLLGAPAPGTAAVATARASIRRRVRLVRDVALALEHAHQHGILHRDIKPENILLATSEQAVAPPFPVGAAPASPLPPDALPWTPKLTDFGLARDLKSSTHLTREGGALGTIAYMSPEQADGHLDALGPRSDLFSLGILLYELSTGRRPFEGDSTASTLYSILQKDPPLPRSINPAVPPDLETITLKCLEKEPARRYPSAAVLAADLAAFLEGEPIWARRQSWPERALRWGRRRRLAAAGLLLVLAAAGVAGAAVWNARTARLEKRRAEEETLGALRKIAAGNVKATLLLRRAGGRMADAEEAFLGPLEESARAVLAQAPSNPEPHFHLGRMYRALLRFEDARRELDRALAANPDFAPALYERSVLTAHALGDRLEQVRDRVLARQGESLARSGLLAAGGLAGEKLDVPDDAALEAGDAEASSLRERLTADIARLEERVEAPAVERGTGAAEGAGAGSAAAASGLTVSAARLACAKGLALAFGAQAAARADEARAQLAEALRGDAKLEEAYEGLARVEEGAGHWDRAIEALGQGAAMDKGYLPFWVGRGRMRGRLGLEQSRRGADPQPVYRDALADYARALELEPRSAESWLRRGMIASDWGLYLSGRGEPPDASYAEAKTCFERALALARDWADVWMLRAILYTNWAQARTARGEDPGPTTEQALADFEKALARNPAAIDGWRARSVLLANWANHKVRTGEDPTSTYERAIADCGKALELNPGAAGSWLSRGQARAEWANYRRNHGEDPDDLYAAGAGDLEKAVELAPKSAGAWMTLGMAYGNWALGRRARGRDPEPLFEKAEAAYGTSLGLNPATAEVWSWRGLLRCNRATWRRSQGRDPEPLYAEGEADLGKGLALNPSSAESWKDRALVRMNWGMYRSGAGADPLSLFERSLEDFGKALSLNGNSAEIWTRRGLLRTVWGLHLKKAGLAPGPLWEAALADFAKGLALNPRQVEALARRGQIRCETGRWSEAVADLEAALRLNPGLDKMFKSYLEEARGRLRGG